MLRKTKKSGFTLVEILIVVIILGILAAIVIPQFTNASQDARNSSVTSQLQTLRSQIELYKLQHGDALPDLTVASGGGAVPGDGLNWVALTGITQFPVGSANNFGPYLQTVPRNPMNNNSNVEDGDGSAAASAAVGFVYDFNGGAGTGRIFATDATGTVLYVE